MDLYFIQMSNFILQSAKKNVSVELYTFQRGCKLTNTEIKIFNGQYPSLKVEYMSNFYDRFLILDRVTGYHIGASIKDAGKKSSAITQLEDPEIVQDILKHL